MRIIIRRWNIHMPVTFGASLRFELNEKWGIETGVTYTLLSTDLRSGSQDSYFEEEQRLHYVGIPLKVDRRLWSNKRFEIYASAGEWSKSVFRARCTRWAL